MNFKWESQKEKLLRYMNIPPEKKLEWLRQMNQFSAKFSSKKTKAIRKRIRESG